MRIVRYGPRLAWRAAEMLGCVAWHGARWGVRRIAAALDRRPAKRGLLLGSALADLCQSLGSTFIKAGQVLSARPDLLSPEIVGPLRRLQDDVAPVGARRIRSVVERSLGGPLSRHFSSFDPRPMSSASVAQVHRARLPGGAVVAVKVRRPGVERRVHDDLLLARVIAGAVARTGLVGSTPIVELIEEVGRSIEDQLDFEIEAESCRRVQRNFADVEGVKVPRIFPELSTRSVLTMEYLSELHKLDGEGEVVLEDRRRAAVAGLRALYKMIFFDGLIHADMHPGNIFVGRWGALVLLDFGLMARLADSDRGHFVDFFWGMVKNDGDVCARVLLSTALHRSDDFDRESFFTAMRDLIDRHSRLTAGDFEVTSFAFELFDIQRRHGLRGATAFTMTILALVVYEGILKRLYRSFDFLGEARGFLVAARYARASSTGQWRPSLGAAAMAAASSTRSPGLRRTP